MNESDKAEMQRRFRKLEYKIKTDYPNLFNDMGGKNVNKILTKMEVVKPGKQKKTRSA